MELWTRPAPASPLAQHSGVDKAASLPDCSPAQCDAGVRVVAASPGQKLVSAHCPGSPPLPGAGPEGLGRELKILSVREVQNQHGAHPRERETTDTAPCSLPSTKHHQGGRREIRRETGEPGVETRLPRELSQQPFLR